MDGMICEWTDEQMDRQTVRWAEGCLDRQMYGQMDSRMNTCMVR
jgi:hypothetical protein